MGAYEWPTQTEYVGAMRGAPTGTALADEPAVEYVEGEAVTAIPDDAIDITADVTIDDDAVAVAPDGTVVDTQGDGTTISTSDGVEIAIGRPGDVLVLDMGEPVKILDVAKRMIAESKKDIEIHFTGLRHGEKMHEVLFSGAEAGEPSEHPLISEVQVPPLVPAMLPADLEGITDPSALDLPACEPVPSLASN